MKKRLLSLLMAGAMVCAACPLSALAGYENLTATRTYTQGQFADVADSVWYASNVKTGYEYGLIDGTGAGRFTPEGSLTVAEAIKLAACLNSIYETGKADFTAGSPWYQPYVTYALEKGIIAAAYPNYNAAATRAQFATIFAAALPEDALPSINDVEDGAIPDVSTGSLYASGVYKLYRSGVLIGSDDKGNFRPATTIRRSEAAAVLSRMVDKKLRLSVTLLKVENTALSAEQIFNQCSPAVFYIEVSDANGTPTASGSGVFLSASGLAVTNYHVIDGAHSAVVETTDGKKHKVTGVYDYSSDFDLALIQVEGSGFSFLAPDSTTALATGATVYAIGSPLGLSNTISEGIVSSASREVEGTEYIQTTASISHGSSGGALIDTKGSLIGITSAYIDGGQNLNLAIPVSNLSKLKSVKLTTLAQVATNSYSTAATYANFYPAPDFGALTGAPIVEKTVENNITYYTYRSADIKISAKQAVEGYIALLEENGFVLQTNSTSGGVVSQLYYQSGYNIRLMFAASTTNGEEHVVIALYRV